MKQIKHFFFLEGESLTLRLSKKPPLSKTCISKNTPTKNIKNFAICYCEKLKDIKCLQENKFPDLMKKVKFTPVLTKL